MKLYDKPSMAFLVSSPICKVLGAFRCTRCADADVAIWFLLGAARQCARVCSLPYPPINWVGSFFDFLEILR